jgi:TM2 domain-containing membrane protein YozV
MSETTLGLSITGPHLGILPSKVRAQLLFEDHRRTKRVAYLLWLFLGWYGVHNFYLRRTGVAIVQLVLSLLVIGMVVTIPWWIVDMFLIPGEVRRQNDLLAAHLGV